MIAAQQQGHRGRFRSRYQQGLQALLGRNVEELAEIGDGAHARRGDAPQVPAGRRPERFRGRRHRHRFHVGGEAVGVRKGDGVLAGVGQHMEFLRLAAADGAGVRLHDPVGELQAVEDPGIGTAHGLVGIFQARFVQVEGVGVLHHELARPHDAEPGPDLVPELRLDLVVVDRQLPVTLEFRAGDIGDDLFVGGTQAEVPPVPVPQPQQFRAEVVPAARLPPQLRRLDAGHGDFQRAGAVHLLADDALDPAQHPNAQRKPAIEPRREPAHDPGPQHELMTDHLRVGGCVPESREG